MELKSYGAQRTAFAEPIAFTCRVNGENLTAEVVNQINHPVYYQFDIRFSNGVEMTVCSTEDSEGWHTDDPYPEHLNAIKEQMDGFLCVVTREVWHKFDFEYKGENYLVWAAQNQDEDGESYSVYFKGDYQFHLRKTKQGWETKSVRVVNPKPIDEELARIISIQIDLAE